MLELGSGTGKHAELLASMGYSVCGVERSEQMIRQARERVLSEENPCFVQVDIREFSFERKFDAAISLFHVMSYLKDLNDFTAVLNQVSEHLDENGVFIFDTWYGPAVLMEKPEIRIKRLENENIAVTRLAEPVMRENENIVEVHYDILVKNKSDGSIKEIKKTHNMRYYFLSEIDFCLKSCGFRREACFEFMTGKELNGNTWGSCFVARKRKDV